MSQMAKLKYYPPPTKINNSSRIKISEDLLNKIKNIKIQNKTIDSLDITSPYTIIPIKNASTFLLLS